MFFANRARRLHQRLLGRLPGYTQVHLRLRHVSLEQPRLLVIEAAACGLPLCAEAEYHTVANGVVEASWLWAAPTEAPQSPHQEYPRLLRQYHHDLPLNQPRPAPPHEA